MKNLWISVRITLAMCVVTDGGLRSASSPDFGRCLPERRGGRPRGARRESGRSGQRQVRLLPTASISGAVPRPWSTTGAVLAEATRARTIRSTFRRWKAVSNRSWRLIRIYRGGTFPLSWLRRAVRVSIPTFRYEGPRFRFVGWRLRGACRRMRCVRSSKRALSVLGWVFSGLTRSMF